MSNINNPGPCANPNCEYGGVATSVHKCPDCNQNIHAPCGPHECEDQHHVLCPLCSDKRPPRDVWCESCKVHGKDDKQPSVLCNDCKQQRPNRRRGQEEEGKQDDETKEQDESAPPPKKKQRRRKKRELPPPSNEHNDTSMQRRLSEPDSIMTYHDELAEFMGYRDGKEYTSPHPFPNSELMKITPQEVARWFAMKAYGKPNPTPEDHPTVGRSSSLEFYKKAISYFMPNRLMGWNYQVGWGNPTRSNDVNQLIAAVKKKEASGLGKESQARRDFDKEEFDQVMLHLASQSDIDLKLGIPCLFKFAYHLIARLGMPNLRSISDCDPK